MIHFTFSLNKAYLSALPRQPIILLRFPLWNYLSAVCLRGRVTVLWQKQWRSAQTKLQVRLPGDGDSSMILAASHPPPQWVVLVTDDRKSTTPHSKEASPSREEFTYALANSREEHTWPLTWHMNKPAHSSQFSWNLGTCSTTLERYTVWFSCQIFPWPALWMCNTDLGDSLPWKLFSSGCLWEDP